MRKFCGHLLLYISLSQCLAAPTQPSDPPIRLPAGPDSVVLTLDYPGGGMGIPPASPGPHLTIRAGGRVTVNDPQGKAKKIVGTIREEELQALLRFAISDCKFFKYDENRVREIIQQKEEARELFLAFDMPYPVIRIRTADREHQARLYPVSPSIGKPWPSVPELTIMRGLEYLEERLRRLMSRVWAGGEAKLEAAVRLANEHLRRQIPTAPALTPEHLRYARQWSDGRTEMTFFLQGPKGERTIEVRLVKPQDGGPTVTVLTTPNSRLP